MGGTKAAHPPTKRRMVAVLADDLIVDNYWWVRDVK